MSRSRRTSPSTVATSSAVIVVAGKPDHLVERALRVAHAAVAGARDQHDRRLVDGDLLGRRRSPQLIGDLLDADRLQLEHLRPRLDRRRHLLDLRRRHHEDDVRRRLLDRLQQRVEGLPREAVDLVDDEDLVAVADRRDAEPGDDDLADLVDLRVGGGVDLEDVDVAALGDLDARVADAARIGGRPCSQFSARARMRAVVVLPTPRGPEKTNDWAIRFAPMALRSVCVTPRCPMTSSNR